VNDHQNNLEEVRVAVASARRQCREALVAAGVNPNGPAVNPGSRHYFEAASALRGLHLAIQAIQARIEQRYADKLERLGLSVACYLPFDAPERPLVCQALQEYHEEFGSLS
jgi:hypothetical protein